MPAAVNTLSTTVTADALWGVFANAVPYISVVVLVAFGFYLIRRMIKGVSKGKAKIKKKRAFKVLFFVYWGLLCTR